MLFVTVIHEPVVVHYNKHPKLFSLVRNECIFTVSTDDAIITVQYVPLKSVRSSRSFVEKLIYPLFLAKQGSNKCVRARLYTFAWFDWNPWHYERDARKTQDQRVPTPHSPVRSAKEMQVQNFSSDGSASFDTSRLPKSDRRTKTCPVARRRHNAFDFRVSSSPALTGATVFSQMPLRYKNPDDFYRDWCAPITLNDNNANLLIQ